MIVWSKLHVVDSKIEFSLFVSACLSMSDNLSLLFRSLLMQYIYNGSSMELCVCKFMCADTRMCSVALRFVEL